MIDAILSIFVDCDGQNEAGNCHISICDDINPVEDILDQCSYEDWLIENDWLPLGEMAYCPSCRFELHD